MCNGNDFKDGEPLFYANGGGDRYCVECYEGRRGAYPVTEEEDFLAPIIYRDGDLYGSRVYCDRCKWEIRLPLTGEVHDGLVRSVQYLRDAHGNFLRHVDRRLLFSWEEDQLARAIESLDRLATRLEFNIDARGAVDSQTEDDREGLVRDEAMNVIDQPIHLVREGDTFTGARSWACGSTHPEARGTFDVTAVTCPVCRASDLYGERLVATREGL